MVFNFELLQTFVCDFKIIVSQITIAINRFRKELKTIKLLKASTFNLSYVITTPFKNRIIKQSDFFLPFENELV